MTFTISSTYNADQSTCCLYPQHIVVAVPPTVRVDCAKLQNNVLIGSVKCSKWTGLKPGTDQETDRKTDRLNLSPSGRGKSFHGRGTQHWSPERPCKFSSGPPRAASKALHVNKIRYAASWSRSQEKIPDSDSGRDSNPRPGWQMACHALTKATELPIYPATQWLSLSA